MARVDLCPEVLQDLSFLPFPFPVPHIGVVAGLPDFEDLFGCNNISKRSRHLAERCPMTFFGGICYAVGWHHHGVAMPKCVADGRFDTTARDHASGDQRSNP